jgi:hypothetical protein
MRTHRRKRPKPKRLSARVTKTGSGDNKVDKLESRNQNQNAGQPDKTRNHYSNSSRYRDATPNSTRHTWVETLHKREGDKALAALLTLWIRGQEKEVRKGEACESLAHRQRNAAEPRGFSSLAQFPTWDGFLCIFPST